MFDDLKITLAQINPTVGDLVGNADKILRIWRECETDLTIFPELAICGYPPEDLILKTGFLDAAEDQIKSLIKSSEKFTAAALISCPWRENGKTYNAMHLIHHGKIIATRYKHHLPNDGVFDEKRLFSAGPLPECIDFMGHKLGVMICEDMWHADVAAHLASQGAEALIALNASPYRVEKHQTRIHHAQSRVNETALPLIYVNQIGGQDELVFDGASFVMNKNSEITQNLKSFEEDIAAIGVQSHDIKSDNESIYSALVLGVRDYAHKNGFPGILIGLSGGIDSALTAVIAADAIGAENVHCVMMPSPFTAQISLDDAKSLANNIGCDYDILPIETAMQAFENTIPNLTGVSHENMQSRTRGLILMALSNQSGKMLLSTGNKSEMAVGYATLYGDMNGGFNALKDVYKTKVFALCRWRNEQDAIIPERIITRPPSAELKDNQTDQDSLPDYDILDDILEKLIERDLSVENIAENTNHDRALVQKIWNMLARSEYKRYQSPPGTKITEKAFGRDRRYPMTSKFKG